MIQQTNNNTLSGNAPMQNFSIEMNESMFTMLTKNIYTNTTLAIIREWSTNAIDSCIDAKLPIRYEVNLPTILSSEFSVRDYGTGLTQEQVLGLFSMLGASSKRESNDFNGTFGVGRMAGLAYTDSFTVNSYKDGVCYSYVISTDSGIPQTISLGNTPTDEPNGLKLSVQTKPEDIDSFKSNAEDLYKYFDVKPICNIELDLSLPDIAYKGSNWEMYSTNNGSHYDIHVVMGNVVYKVSDKEFKGKPYYDLLEGKLCVHTPLGSVSITPGREALSMDPKTIKYLDKQFTNVHKELIEHVEETLKTKPKGIERVSYYNGLRNSIDTSIIKDIGTSTLLEGCETYFDNSGYRTELTVPEIDLTFTKTDSGGSKLIKCWVRIVRPYTYRPTYFMIQDQRVGIKESVEKYLDELNETTYTLIVIKPKETSKERIQQYVDLAKQYLSDIGVTSYVMASDYYTAPVKVKSTKSTVPTSTDIFFPITFSEYNGSGTRSYNSIKPEHKGPYYYVETTGLDVNNMEVDSLITYLKFARIYNSQTSGTKLEIIGVPKKGLAGVKKDPRFIPLRGALDHLKDKVRVADYKAISDLRYSTSRYVNLNNNLPKGVTEPFLDYITEFNKQNPASRSVDTCEELEAFGCTVVTAVLPESEEVFMSRYPLLKNIWSNSYYFESKDIGRYIELEQFKQGII